MNLILAFVVGVAVGHFGLSKVVAFVKAKVASVSNPAK